MNGIDRKKYRFVLNVNNRLMYYSGEILDENSEYYSVNEIKLGSMQIFKKNVVTVRRLENE